ncbi:MAG: hypothetical protein HOK67_25980, partial [Deltaproteobacteria bacterium]|nr:hypothetical protein [Deltaproteobacteria bacterium]
MEELEYLFKHALAQEATYESTLIQQRKALHGKVAQSIEKIFQERLHEFYGMLAFHYSKADELEKTEEYMLKAGDEALRSSASSEALQFFQEALRLYLAKYGNDADAEKLANFEKNIAIALYNKAQWQESVTYFDSVLARWGAPLPKRGFLGMLKLGWHLLVLIKMIYLKSPNSKRKSGVQENEAFELQYVAGQALPYVDSLRQFQVAMAIFTRAMKFDLSTTPMGPGYLVALANVFSCSGLSFRLSNRLLELWKNYEDIEDVWDSIQPTCHTSIAYYCQGAWKKIGDLEENL